MKWLYSESELETWEKSYKKNVGVTAFKTDVKMTLDNLKAESVEDKINELEQEKLKLWINQKHAHIYEYLQRWLMSDYE